MIRHPNLQTLRHGTMMKIAEQMVSVPHHLLENFSSIVDLWTVIKYSEQPLNNNFDLNTYIKMLKKKSNLTNRSSIDWQGS